jgi:hypothetical protein
MAVVLVLTFAATMCSARAWSSLLPTVDRAVAHEAIYVSQLAKYLPVGGIAQAAAQLGLTVSSGAAAATVAAAWVVAMICAIGAASLVGIGVVAVPGVPAALRVVAVLAVSSLLFLHPVVLRWAFGVVERRIPRLGVDSSHVPRPSEVARCLAWSVANQLAFATAVAVAVTSLVRLRRGDPPRRRRGARGGPRRGGAGADGGAARGLAGRPPRPPGRRVHPRRRLGHPPPQVTGPIAGFAAGSGVTRTLAGDERRDG